MPRDADPDRLDVEASGLRDVHDHETVDPSHANTSSAGSSEAPSMNVHVCTVDDLAGLDEVMPLGDGAHHQRLKLQQSGSSTYLVASWVAPVGVCIVRWERPFDASVAQRWPDCVEVNHLHVLPQARNRGVGRSLIGAAEALCRERKIELVGIGVADDNSDAARLYQRLGYRDSDHRYVVDYEFIDPDGVPRHASEHNRFLVKVFSE